MKIRVLICGAALAGAGLACALPGARPTTAPTARPLAELQSAVAALPAGAAARGQQLFTGTLACHVCHIDQPIGPAIPGDPPLATRAAQRRPGYAAEVYLYESITDPSALVVPGFDDGVMPDDFARTLSAQQLADLIAYLKTLR